MANVEVLVKNWLDTFVGSDYPVSAEKPKSPPASFILVDRTGGPREAMVLDRAEILIEVYHKSSRLDASEKANEIADRIVELEAFNHNITHASINSVVSLDDTLGQYRRYQVYCDVYLRR
jgi:hypothetical protein